MPRIIYGTAWKQERTEDLVVTAVQAGFRGIDTACQPRHYQEPLVGTALQRLQTQGIGRKDLFLQTKFTPLPGHDPNRVPYDQHAPLQSQVAQSFKTSQQNLQTDYVDSLLLHSPLSPYCDLLTVWRALEQIHTSGGARQLGISNCYDLARLKRLYADAEVKPTIVQNRFYRDSGYDAALRQWCRQHDIVYQSFWTLTANPHILSSETVFRLARRHRKTPEQIFFGFLGQIGIVPLTGTCSERHMREDLNSFDINLTGDELESMHRLIA
ncbi:aldo/keto reductase family protein [Methylomarinum vadi]|uniref:aldo/keto reductase family protein n=1 Tax=Methylomarinum vadi TaxID=438855 RepID=UPI001F1EB6E1|nr:aldo/keto reductase [Methylomarinum vadi]